MTVQARNARVDTLLSGRWKPRPFGLGVELSPPTEKRIYCILCKQIHADGVHVCTVCTADVDERAVQFAPDGGIVCPGCAEPTESDNEAQAKADSARDGAELRNEIGGGRWPK